MPPIPPLDPGLVHQLEVGLVDQAGRAQSVTRPLALKLPVRDPAQLAVDQRKEPVDRSRIAVAQLEEEIGDLLAIGRGGRPGSRHVVGGKDDTSLKMDLGRGDRNGTAVDASWPNEDAVRSPSAAPDTCPASR